MMIDLNNHQAKQIARDWGVSIATPSDLASLIGLVVALHQKIDSKQEVKVDIDTDKLAEKVAEIVLKKLPKTSSVQRKGGSRK